MEIFHCHPKLVLSDIELTLTAEAQTKQILSLKPPIRPLEPLEAFQPFNFYKDTVETQRICKKTKKPAKSKSQENHGSCTGIQIHARWLDPDWHGPYSIADLG